ncbi:MAG: hypothetical protein C0483_24200 [Pirellula sp.]|nr:hypothetical protein [Pirellula sp.]
MTAGRKSVAMHSLRFPAETDDQFRIRAERTVGIAKALVDGCPRNKFIQCLLDKGRYTLEDCKRSPTVRVEFEQAIAFGGIGETLEATKNRHWGEGPWIMTLEEEDVFDPDFISYLYRENSVYNRRFDQRKRMKELLGRKHRHLVEDAKHYTATKRIFLRDLMPEKAEAIRKRLNVSPEVFWRACKGKQFLDLPKRLVHLELFDD